MATLYVIESIQVINEELEYLTATQFEAHYLNTCCVYGIYKENRMQSLPVRCYHYSFWSIVAFQHETGGKK